MCDYVVFISELHLILIITDQGTEGIYFVGILLISDNLLLTFKIYCEIALEALIKVYYFKYRYFAILHLNYDFSYFRSLVVPHLLPSLYFLLNSLL